MTHPTTRRDFLATSAGVASASVLLPALSSVYAAGNDTIKIGLIGCGNRGSGAAVQALRADKFVKLVAMGDVFKDKIDDSLKEILKAKDIADKVDVKPDKCFVGFDAYKDVINSGVDVVLLTAAPGFRPLHLDAAVKAGKHVFCEKPMAVDGPGVRSVMETVKLAKDKNLALVAGFCYRYQRLKQEWMKRIHGGDIGKIIALQCIYHANELWHRDRKDEWDDMTYQLRNWLYFTWLSGDHIVEQACHSIDKMAWAMQDEPPVSCIGTGGRARRTGKQFGHIFDHHSVVYEWKSGVKMFHSCRQQDNTKVETSDWVFGTEGTAEILSQRDHRIKGAKAWSGRPRRGDKDDMYQNEHDDLFASIRSGKPINNGDWMTKSTLMAIMGRMATYTGEEITWERALKSEESLAPKEYKFGPLPAVSVAVPGVTKIT